MGILEFNPNGSLKIPESMKRLESERVKKEDWFEVGKESIKEEREIKKGKRYFLCITHPENYVVCMKNKIWGVEPNRYYGIYETKIGDYLLFYMKSPNKQFGVIGEVASEVFEDHHQLWFDGTYPYRIRIKTIFSPKYPVGITQDLIDSLNFITRKDNKWGTCLQTSMLQISERDFFIILDKLKGAI